MVEKIVFAKVGDVEIRVAVIVIVSPVSAFGEGDFIDARSMRDIFKSPIALVMKKPARLQFVTDEYVDEAIIIEVRPDCRVCAIYAFIQAALRRHISKRAVAVV